MAHRVTRRIEHFQLHRLADLDDVARPEPSIDTGNALPRVLVCEQLGAGRRNHSAVAAGVIAVLMRVQDLRDLPAVIFGRGQAFLMIQRIDGERFAGVGIDDEVVKVAVVVGGPDLLDDHGVYSQSVGACCRWPSNRPIASL